MSSPNSPGGGDPEPGLEVEEGRAELNAFAGLHLAIARLCLRDGRPRKEIAEAAHLNASMLSGFCSGRRIPSIEHLDRLLTALDAGIEELTYELRALDYGMSKAPLVLWPRFLKTEEGGEAAALLTKLLVEVRGLLMDQVEGGPAAIAAREAAKTRKQPRVRKRRPRSETQSDV